MKSTTKDTINTRLATSYGWTIMEDGRWLSPNGSTTSTSPPDYCRNIVVLVNVIRWNLTSAERAEVAQFILQMRKE